MQSNKLQTLHLKIMADQEKVTRLKSISDVDAWVTQFTIDLEDRKPELAKMLTKAGWDTLPDATKERTNYSSAKIKAVEFNKAAHKKIIKAMGLHKDLIDKQRHQRRHLMDVLGQQWNTSGHNWERLQTIT